MAISSPQTHHGWRPRSPHYAAIWATAALLACGGDGTGPDTGELNVVVTTTGQDLDADGYTLRIDARDVGPVSANSGMSITALTAGNHVVELTGISSNCGVSGDNPRTVAMRAAARPALCLR